jgi:hypothetical protein
MMPRDEALKSVAIIDIRDGGTVRYAREGRERARALRDDCLAWFPGFVGPLVPVLDRLAKHWLSRSRSPYLGEIEEIATTLGFDGVWLLNGSYQWGCTALARDEDGVPWLARTLDWPFPGLGQHVEIARMTGAAGEFFSPTWPGYAGVLTGMAPGRFAIAMNQGPLWRRTRHPWLRPFDIMANAVQTWRRVRHVPPDQVLRGVFEQCRSFEDAKRMLETTPIARPAIFTLAGCAPAERCVIERAEEAAESRSTQTAAANDWLRRSDGWEARVGGRLVLTCRYDEAAENSRGRREAMANWSGTMSRDRFSWLQPPVLNPFTRMAVEMCAARGTLRVVGYERPADGGLAKAVTAVGEVCAVG